MERCRRESYQRGDLQVDVDRLVAPIQAARHAHRLREAIDPVRDGENALGCSVWLVAFQELSWMPDQH